MKGPEHRFEYTDEPGEVGGARDAMLRIAKGNLDACTAFILAVGRVDEIDETKKEGTLILDVMTGGPDDPLQAKRLRHLLNYMILSVERKIAEIESKAGES